MQNKFRQKAASWIIVIASIIWIVGLIITGCAQTALPWCLTLILVIGVTIASAIKPQNTYTSVFFHKATREPISLQEAYAFTYVLSSLIFGSWIIYHHLYKPPILKVARQVVDIELKSLTDFQNRHDLLPGSVEKDTLRKHTGDTITSPGEIVEKPIPSLPKKQESSSQITIKKDAAQEDPNTKTKTPEPVISTLPTIVNSPWSSLKVKTFSSTNTIPQSKEQKANDPSFLEEVTPPEMVEITDNDGDESLNVWQAGGHSENGLGSASDLIAYLKELNKRIKRVWEPPSGQTRKTEVLFRLERSGKLVSAHITKTSGNAESDQAALKALTAAAPFDNLPKDYPNTYLDLRYRFNYNVNELTEVPNKETY